MSSIMNLENKINKLKTEDRNSFNLFNEIFYISSSEGTMKIPSIFKDKVRIYFGNRDAQGNIIESKEEVIERISTQKVVKTYNKWTGEGSLFNSLRASRPGMRPEELDKERKKIDEYIKASEKDCDFCDPEKYTPEDVFGRIKGQHCITGANIAKYDAWSSMIFFKKHNPLDFTLEELSDYIETGFKWFEKVYNYDKSFKFPFFLWNCLQKAGASQVHGHAQILMAKDIHYAKPEFSRRVFQQYSQNPKILEHKTKGFVSMDKTVENRRFLGNENRSMKKIEDFFCPKIKDFEGSSNQGKNYFEDLYKVHKALGLALDDHVRGFVSLTPIKEKEFVIVSGDDPSESSEVKEAIYKVLRCYIDKLGVTSFNLIISCPQDLWSWDSNQKFDSPQTRSVWDSSQRFDSPADEVNFPYIIKIVDRGNIFKPTADIGAMELYGSSVIADDPYNVIKAIGEFNP